MNTSTINATCGHHVVNQDGTVLKYIPDGTPKEKYHNDRVVLDWKQKLPIAREIAEFHWRNKTKYEREHITEKLAKEEGDLSMLQSFITSIKKKDGKWTFNYCTSSLIDPNHDYCRRQYLKSIR